MALIKYKPTSPGTRAVIKIDRSHLHKGGPHLPLTTSQSKTGARNLPHVEVIEVPALNPLALAAYDKVLMTVGAVKLIEERLQ